MAERRNIMREAYERLKAREEEERISKLEFEAIERAMAAAAEAIAEKKRLGEWPPTRKDDDR